MKINEKRFDFGEVARLISAARIDGDPPVRFKWFEHQLIAGALESAVDFQLGTPEIDRRRIIADAISIAGAGGQVTPELVKSALTQAERKYLQLSFNRYYLATSITIRPFSDLRSVIINGTRINFAAELPFRFSRQTVTRQLEEHIRIQHPERLTQCWLPVRARTKAAAFDIGAKRLDLLRGIWNHWINRQTSARRYSGMNKPVNSICPGPIYTLHPDTNPSEADGFWYQLPNEQHEELFDFARSAASWRKAQRYTQRLLADHPYRDELERLFVRYCRALDGVDFDVAFVRLWSVLEALTGSGADYDAVIKRTLFLVAPSEASTARLLLEHLRDVRNGTVHNDRSRYAIEDHLFQLKFYVELLFEFHLVSRPRFTSIGAAADFLNLPRDTAELHERIALHRRALAYRSRPPRD
jgi:hypothetical protein